MSSEHSGVDQDAGARSRSVVILIFAFALGGGAGSLFLLLNGQAPLVVAIPFTLGGIFAGFIARRLPLRKVELRAAHGMDATLVESVAERRARQERISAEWMSMRGQWVAGSHGLTTVFVGAPAGVMVAAGLYQIAFPIGLLFLGITWLHWRAGWKFHRSLDGVSGVSTKWPAGSLSPADRRFRGVLVSVALVWFVALEVLAVLARQGSQAVTMVATLIATTSVTWLVARRHGQSYPKSSNGS